MRRRTYKTVAGILSAVEKFFSQPNTLLKGYSYQDKKGENIRWADNVPSGGICKACLSGAICYFSENRHIESVTLNLVKYIVNEQFKDSFGNPMEIPEVNDRKQTQRRTVISLVRQAKKLHAKRTQTIQTPKS